MQIFTFNSTLRTSQKNFGLLKTCEVGVWWLEWIRSPIPSILQHKNDIQTLLKQLAGLWSDNEPSCPTHRHCMFSYIQAWLDRNQTHTNTSEFSGSVGHQCAELQAPAWPCPAISCADMQDTSVASRGNSGFFFTSAWEVSPAVFGFLERASVTCCFWHKRVTQPVSHDQEVSYQLWNHLITLNEIIITSLGQTALVSLLLFSIIRRYNPFFIFIYSTEFYFKK